jgi:hypothetical protein
VDAMKSTAQRFALFCSTAATAVLASFLNTTQRIWEGYQVLIARWLYLIAARAEDLPISEGLNSGRCTSRNQV